MSVRGVERRVLEVFLERVRQQPIESDDERDERLRSVRNRVVDLLDFLAQGPRGLPHGRCHDAVPEVRAPPGPQRQPLLRGMLDTDFESEPPSEVPRQPLAS